MQCSLSTVPNKPHGSMAVFELSFFGTKSEFSLDMTVLDFSFLGLFSPEIISFYVKNVKKSNSRNCFGIRYHPDELQAYRHGASEQREYDIPRCRPRGLISGEEMEKNGKGRQDGGSSSSLDHFRLGKSRAYM